MDPRRIDVPQPGTFCRRLCKGGWKVPSRIHHVDGLWWAEIDGVVYPSASDPYDAPKVMDIWQGDAETDETEWRLRNQLRDWCRDGGIDHPCVRPEKPINHLMTPIDFESEDHP